MFEVHQFPHPPLQNYGVLLHDPKSGETAAIDAGHGESYLEALKQTGWALTQIWITHHHHDHVEGLSALRSASDAEVIGPQGISGVDRVVQGGDSFSFAGVDVSVIHTPGHTSDMLNFYVASEAIVFTGDTLFVMGCGRLFEGGADTMWDSLQKLMGLPPETRVYCSHEYTLANANFAVTIDPENVALKSRLIEIEQLADQGDPTVPTTIAAELATNPFLRCADKSIREHLNMTSATDAEVFAEIRRRKDSF